MKIADRLKKENKGFTLIEAIVVVLIIGIAATITVISIGYATKSNATHCAKRLSALLDLTRTQSMGMVDGNVLLRLEKNSDGDYEAISIQKVAGVFQEIDREEIGNSALTINYTGTADSGSLTNTGDHIDFVYKKNTGAFTSTYTSIQIIGSRTATVTLVTDTGRNYFN